MAVKTDTSSAAFRSAVAQLEGRAAASRLGYGAVLIDATIVRAVLLPAAMKLLGDRNWYLPSWLGWLPRLDHHAEPGPEPVPVTA